MMFIDGVEYKDFETKEMALDYINDFVDHETASVMEIIEGRSLDIIPVETVKEWKFK